MSHVWVVGQSFPDNNEWEIQGVFDDKQLAIDCVSSYAGDLFFIGRMNLNKPLPLDSCEWDFAWWPKLEDEPV